MHIYFTCSPPYIFKVCLFLLHVQLHLNTLEVTARVDLSLRELSLEVQSWHVAVTVLFVPNSVLINEHAYAVRTAGSKLNAVLLLRESGSEFTTDALIMNSPACWALWRMRANLG